MKSILSLLLSLLFMIPSGFYAKRDEPEPTRVVTKVNRYYNTYKTGEVSEDYFLEYDADARLIKADTRAYSEWQYLFSPSIIYTNIIVGTDEYEYEGSSRKPSRITRYDESGTQRFTVDYEYDSQGRELKETYTCGDDVVVSTYSYDSDEYYDYVHVYRVDGRHDSEFTFKYYDDGTLHNWNMRQNYTKDLKVRRDVAIERDGENRVYYAVNSTPALTRYPSWCYMLYYKDDGELDYIEYSHPYEGIMYRLTFTYEDIE